MHHLGYAPGAERPASTTDQCNGVTAKTVLTGDGRVRWVREIQGYLAESNDGEVSTELIGTVTDSVLADVTAWQATQQDAVYPVVVFHTLWVKARDDNMVRNKAMYLAQGAAATAHARFSGFGSRRPRARSSG